MTVTAALLFDYLAWDIPQVLENERWHLLLRLTTVPIRHSLRARRPMLESLFLRIRVESGWLVTVAIKAISLIETAACNPQTIF